MPAVDAIVAVVWAVFLTLVSFVMMYFTFVVSARQDLTAGRTGKNAPKPKGVTPQPAD